MSCHYYICTVDFRHGCPTGYSSMALWLKGKCKLNDFIPILPLWSPTCATSEDSMCTLSNISSSRQCTFHLSFYSNNKLGQHGTTCKDRLNTELKPTLKLSIPEQGLGHRQHWKQQHQMKSRTDPCNLSSPVKTIMTLARYLPQRLGANLAEHLRKQSSLQFPQWSSMPVSSAIGRSVQGEQRQWPGFQTPHLLDWSKARLAPVSRT